MKFVTKFRLPLFRQMGRAEYREAIDFGPVEKFAGDEDCFDGFADTDIVGDEQADWIEFQGEHQRD